MNDFHRFLCFKIRFLIALPTVITFNNQTIKMLQEITLFNVIDQKNNSEI